MSKIGTKFQQLFSKHPVLTTSISTALLSGLGDVLTQKFLEKKPKIEFSRVGRASIIGFAGGPLIYYWNAKALPYITGKIISKNAGEVPKTLTKIVIDQCSFVFFINGLQFFANEYSKSKSFDKAIKNVQKKILPCVKTN